jgi:histidine ammonia-lyase
MIKVGGSRLTLEDFKAILFDGKLIELDTTSVEKVQTGFEFLKNFIDHKLIYGINTGFGPMAQYKISDENVLQLQYNLIRSHSSGGGQILNQVSIQTL